MSARTHLQARPPCATTGIGSLPHNDLATALELSLRHDLPYLPQLPSGRPAELMLPAALSGLPGLQVDPAGDCRVDLPTWRGGTDALAARLHRPTEQILATFEPLPQASIAFHPFLAEVRSRHLPVAKVQLAGPATLRWLTPTSDGRRACDVPALDQQLFELTHARALALALAVRRAGATPVVFLDEPGLAILDPSLPEHQLVLRELALLTQSLQQVGAAVGLHCCANTHWPSVLGLGLDLIAIDARLSLDALLEDTPAWHRFVASGGALCAGVVPTDPSAQYVLAELLESVEASLRATCPPHLEFEALLRSVVLTPACGLALRPPGACARIISELQQAQLHFRELCSPSVAG
jgi:methionine synthase II (cobalamin-independent)